MTDFSPYQSEEPQQSRSSPYFQSSSQSIQGGSPVISGIGSNAGPNGGLLGGGNARVNQYETRLPLRIDIEAIMCYVALPPVGAVLLLVLETQNDYVRFHAWQASLVFTGLVILHLIFTFSAFLSWSLFVVDLGLMATGAWHCYKDADDLARWELPFVGRIASSYVDSE